MQDMRHSPMIILPYSMTKLWRENFSVRRHFPKNWPISPISSLLLIDRRGISNKIWLFFWFYDHINNGVIFCLGRLLWMTSAFREGGMFVKTKCDKKGDAWTEIDVLFFQGAREFQKTDKMTGEEHIVYKWEKADVIYERVMNSCGS